jgi:hypothetical protein
VSVMNEVKAERAPCGASIFPATKRSRSPRGNPKPDSLWTHPLEASKENFLKLSFLYKTPT